MRPNLLVLCCAGLVMPEAAQANEGDEPQTVASATDSYRVVNPVTPRKAEAKWTVKPLARLQYDVASIDAPAGVAASFDDLEEFRRARIGLDVKSPFGMSARFELEFAGDDPEITNAYLAYATRGLTITVGQHNNFQSLEEMTSTNDTSFIERAAFTDAFNLGRKLGASVQLKDGDWLAQGGVFLDNLELLEQKDVSLDTRLVYAPKIGRTQWHFGGSLHHTELGDTVASLRYRQRPLVHGTSVRLIDTRALSGVDTETSLGLEAAAIRGPFHAMAEVYWLNAGLSGRNDALFSGGAVEAGYFVTNDTRGYSGGHFRALKVTNPVGGGGFGAVSVNVRYDWLELNDGTIRGGRQDGLMASLIWNPVNQLRFMVNYAHLIYSDAVIPAGTDRDYSVDVVAARAQFAF